MKKELFFIICMLILSAGIISAAAIGEDLHLNIQTTNSTGSVVTGTFNFIFNISTSGNCNNVVYSNHTNLTTDSRGIVSYYLENVSLDFSNQYWLCHYRGGTLMNASKIARTPYSFTAKNISAQGIIADSNLNLTGKNITASTGFFNLAWSYLTSLPNIIYGLWTENNYNNLLISNGTAIGYNQTILNNSIVNIGLDIGFNSTYNQTYHNYWTANYTNNSNFLDGYNSGYFMPFNTSVSGNFDFNGGWQTGGFSIVGGNIFVQTGFFYNISGLEVTHLFVNGSLLPARGFDNQFDLGNASYRWRDLFVGRTANITGTLYVNNINISSWQTNVSINYTQSSNTYTDTASINLQTNITNLNASYVKYWYNQSLPYDKWFYNYTIASYVGWNFSGLNITTGASNYKVGINFNNPFDNFAVNGSVRFQNSSGTLAFYINDTNGFVGIGVANPKTTLEIGSETFSVNSTSGNVGIGTTSPGSFKLNVKGGNLIVNHTSNPEINVVDPAGGTGRFGISTTGTTIISDALADALIITNDQGAVQIGTATAAPSSARMTILTNGNIGIGTTSPGTLLHVQKAGTNDPLVLINGTAITDAMSLMVGDSNTDNSISLWKAGAVGHFSTSSTAGDVGIRIGNSNDDFMINTGTGAAQFFVEGSTGEVGIGTASPNSILHLNSTGPYLVWEESDASTGDDRKWSLLAAGDQFIGQVNNNAFNVGANWLVVDRTGTTVDQVVFPNGKVGIGTASPGTKLEVYDTTGAGGALVDVLTLTSYPAAVASDNAAAMVFKTRSNAPDVPALARIYAPLTDGTVGAWVGDLKFQTATAGVLADRMTIKGNGNVGIGTTGPNDALHVYRDYNSAGSRTTNAATIFIDGAAGKDAWLGWGIAGTESFVAGFDEGNKRLDFWGHDETTWRHAMTMTTAGNVGIGTTAPAVTLSVNGGSNNARNVQFFDSDLTAGSWTGIGFGRSWVANEGGALVYNYTGAATDYLALGILGDSVVEAGQGIVVKAGGNVGIGTTSPGSELEIEKANDHPGLYIEATTAAYNPHIQFLQASSAYDGEIGINAATGHIYIGDVGTATGILNIDLVNDRVGIGTTSPTHTLNVVGTANISGSPLLIGTTAGSTNQMLGINYGTDGSAYGAIRFYSGGTNTHTIHSFATAWDDDTLGKSAGAINIDGTNGVTIGGWNAPYVVFDDANSRVGIGTTSPNSKLSVGGDGIANAGVYGIGTTFGIYGSGTYGVYGNSTSNGVYGRGVGSGNGVVGYSTSGYSVIVDASSTTYDLYVTGSGYATGSFVSGASDIKFKKDIINIDNALEKVKQLRSVYFNWRTDEFPNMSLETTRQIGFIAQEVQSILPEVVVADNKDGTLGLKYDKMVPLVVSAIQELNNKVDNISIGTINKSIINHEMRIGNLELNNSLFDARIQALEKQNAQLIDDIKNMKKLLCEAGIEEFKGLC